MHIGFLLRNNGVVLGLKQVLFSDVPFSLPSFSRCETRSTEMMLGIWMIRFFVDIRNPAEEDRVWDLTPVKSEKAARGEIARALDTRGYRCILRMSCLAGSFSSKSSLVTRALTMKSSARDP